MESILVLGLFSFAVTLIINKSSLFECKREFVEYRYKLDAEKDNFFHWFWYKMWSCSMCLGMWSSVFGALFLKTETNYVFLVSGAFGLNWLFHCVEKYLFEASRLIEGQNKEKTEK